jgi:hypothetical protein
MVCGSAKLMLLSTLHGMPVIIISLVRSMLCRISSFSFSPPLPIILLNLIMFPMKFSILVAHFYNPLFNVAPLKALK